MSKKQQEDYHYIIKDHIDCARSQLQHAINAAMYVIGVNTNENEDVEKMIEIIMQRPDKTACKVFTFLRDVLDKLEK